jgi:metacaspase-1
MENYGFKESNMIVLTDDPNSELIPTKLNIIKAIEWLVNDPQVNDS